MKLNEHFYTYYNNNPLKQIHKECLFKCILGFTHCFMIYISFNLLYRNEKDEFDIFLYTSTIIMNGFILIIGLCICKCISAFKKCLRIDIIYSFDFKAIFIGSLDIANSKTFITKAEFIINEIDRFVLTKSKNNEEGFHLSVILKGNINRDLFYIKDQQIELQGLEYILNEKLVN